MRHDGSEGSSQLFQQLAQIPEDVILLCVGDGFHAKQIHPLMQQVLCRRLILKPWLDQPSDYLDASDAFICWSENEGGPLTVIEAMLHGTPVVATQVGIVPELVTSDGQPSAVNALRPGDVLTAMETKPERLAEIQEYIADRVDYQKVR